MITTYKKQSFIILVSTVLAIVMFAGQMIISSDNSAYAFVRFHGGFHGGFHGHGFHGGFHGHGFHGGFHGHGFHGGFHGHGFHGGFGGFGGFPVASTVASTVASVAPTVAPTVVPTMDLDLTSLPSSMMTVNTLASIKVLVNHVFNLKVHQFFPLADFHQLLAQVITLLVVQMSISAVMQQQ